MAFESPLFQLTGVEADADLSTKQFFCVKMTTADKRIGLCDTDGETVLGVLQNKPNAAGKSAQVLAAGITKIEAAEALTAGDHWKTDSSGKAAKAEVTITGADVGDYVGGQVLVGAAAAELATVTIGLATFLVEAQ